MKRKIFVYQMLPRLFGNLNNTNKPFGSRAKNGCGTFEDISDAALQAIAGIGFTHIWYTGVIAHATCEGYAIQGHHPDCPEIVKGRAGSPYAVRDYYDVSPELAKNPEHRMQEFQSLIERTHKRNLKVIIDHIPNHVARDYRGTLSPNTSEKLGTNDDNSKAFDLKNDFYYVPGQYLSIPQEAYTYAKKQAPEALAGAYVEFPAKATGNDQFSAFPGIDDWYETVKLNYGQNPDAHDGPFTPTMLWTKMLDIILFWCEKGVDGFRCDMAGMVPIQYWEWVIYNVKQQYPNMLFIGEIYEPQRYSEYIQAGFDYLYDKVGFYDTLIPIMKAQASASNLSETWKQMSSFEDHMLRFIENHDEQRIASNLVCGKAEPGIPGFMAAASMHRGPAMLYFGQELGINGDDAEGYSQYDGRTSIFDYWGYKEFQTWYGEGNYDYSQLPDNKKGLLQAYKGIILLVRSIPAMDQGGFFDLQYAQDPAEYNLHRLYAYLRYDSTQVYLIILNFGQSEQNTTIKIPQHAGEFLPFSLNHALKPVIIQGFEPEEMQFFMKDDPPIVIAIRISGYSVCVIQIEQTLE